MENDFSAGCQKPVDVRRPPAVDGMTTEFLVSHLLHKKSVRHLLGIPEKKLLVIDIILGCICMFGITDAAILPR